MAGMSGRKEKLSLGGEAAAESPGRSPVFSDHVLQLYPTSSPCKEALAQSFRATGREAGLLAPGRALGLRGLPSGLAPAAAAHH